MARKYVIQSVVIFFLVLLGIIHASDDDDDDDNTRTTASSSPSSLSSLQRWQECDIFLAPSGWMNGGFGVFTNRAFQKDEIVMVAPLFLPFEFELYNLVNSALRDYMYGYRRAGAPMGVIVPGNTMFLNHHPQAPNVVFANFGNEPSEDNPTTSQAVGLVAKRDIAQGEELFATYWEEDGGAEWFRSRGLPLMNIPEEGLQLRETDLAEQSKRFCSKIYAGVGLPTWTNRIMPTCPTEHLRYKFETGRLAPFDAGLFGAVAKVDVQPGDILENSPALIMLKQHVDKSALAPLVFAWSDLPLEHQFALRQLRDMGGLFVQHQDHSNDWQRQDRFHGFSQIVLFAGSIASLRRVGEDGNEANCRIDVLPSGMEDGNARIVLQLVAMKHIKAGEVLKGNLPPTSATEEEMALLRRELTRTGQPMTEVENTAKAHSNGYKEKEGDRGDEL